MAENKSRQNRARQELAPENLDDIAGGAQVEIQNVVKNNTMPVKIGPTVVINM